MRAGARENFAVSQIWDYFEGARGPLQIGGPLQLQAFQVAKAGPGNMADERLAKILRTVFGTAY